MNTQSLILDLSKRHMPNQIVRIGQGDLNGTTISASIMNNGVPESMSGKSAKFCIKTPAGGYYEDENCSVSGNTVSYVVNETFAASSYGYTDDAYFMISYGEVRCSTNRFRVKVERDATSGADPSKSYTNDLEKAIEDLKELAAGIKTEVDEKIEERLNERLLMVYFGLDDEGNFCAYVPDTWDDVEFSTETDYDDDYYGSLVLSGVVERSVNPISKSRIHEITGL